MEEWVDYYLMSKKDVLDALDSNEKKGLSSEEAKKRLEKFGKNEIKRKKSRGILNIVLSQFRNSLLIILLIAAGVSYYIGQEIEAFGIVVAVVLSVMFGTYLEYKADKSIEELSKYTEEKVVVLRDGKMFFLSTKELVPGDIVVISEGQRVPADMYILKSNELEVDESLLTGESEAVIKKAGQLKKETPLAERRNMLFAGTDVLRGSAKAIVVSTGLKTEVGKISSKLEEIEEEESELYKDVAELGKYISALAVGIILLFLFAGALKGGNLIELILLAITLAVAAIPEGLTTVLTIILALGIKRMADNNAIVRKLATIESLGRVELIATDKTGTLTEGRVSLESIYYNGILYTKKSFSRLKEAIKDIYTATEVKLTDKGFVGNEVDVAIAKAAKEIGKLEKRKVRDIVPFSSDKGYMKVILSNGEELIKGSPEVILSMCNSVLKKGKVVKLSGEELREVEDIIQKEASRGMKVVLFAKKKGRKTILNSLLFFRDPPKEGVKETIEKLKTAGIEIIMITGDNPITAKAIADEVSIEGKAVLWGELKEMKEEDMYKALMESKIIARATPEAKLRIVEVLSKKHVVAVTGDGVNDALALKKASIGVVMGKHGTTVSREVADIVLIDDRFPTLTNAIEIGRNIIQNISNFLRFQLTANVSAMLLIFYGFMSSKESLLFTLTPLQILWVNLILDGPPALAQGFEPPKEDVMKRRPRKKIKLLGEDMLKVILFSAIYISTLSFFLFLRADSYFKALLFSFTALVFFQLWNALNCRSLKAHFFEKLFENKVLIYTILVMGIIQIAISLNTTLSAIFIPEELVSCVGCKEALSILDLIEIIILTSSIIVVDEIRKVANIWTGHAS